MVAAGAFAKGCMLLERCFGVLRETSDACAEVASRTLMLTSARLFEDGSLAAVVRAAHTPLEWCYGPTAASSCLSAASHQPREFNRWLVGRRISPRWVSLLPLSLIIPQHHVLQQSRPSRHVSSPSLLYSSTPSPPAAGSSLSALHFPPVHSKQTQIQTSTRRPASCSTLSD